MVHQQFGAQPIDTGSDSLLSRPTVMTYNSFADGIVRDVNRQAEKTFGYAAGEMLGREVADLIVPPSLAGGTIRRGMSGWRYLAD